MSEQGKNPSSFAYVMNPVRESRLLGKRIQFERSTALGFSPDTLLRMMAGRSLSNSFGPTPVVRPAELRAVNQPFKRRRRKLLLQVDVLPVR